MVVVDGFLLCLARRGVVSKLMCHKCSSLSSEDPAGLLGATLGEEDSSSSSSDSISSKISVGSNGGLKTSVANGDRRTHKFANCKIISPFCPKASARYLPSGLKHRLSGKRYKSF